MPMYEKQMRVPHPLGWSADNFCKNVEPDQNQICLTLKVFMKEFFEKVYFEKNQLMMATKKHEKLPSGQRVKDILHTEKLGLLTVIHLQFWAYGSWDSLFPISMSLTANL